MKSTVLCAEKASRLLSRGTLLGPNTKHCTNVIRNIARSAQAAEGTVALDSTVAADVEALQEGRHVGQKRFRKVNVALHVGYVGTNYTGEQHAAQ